MRDAGGAQSRTQAFARALALVLRAALSVLRAPQRLDERQRLVALRPPRVDEGKRVPPLRRRDRRNRRDLEIERGDRLVRRFEVGFGVLPFHFNAGQLDRALAQGGEFPRAGHSRRARRVVAPHRRLEHVGARPVEGRAMRRPRRIARGANLRRGLVAQQIRAARGGRGFDPQPFRFAGLGRQKI